MGKENKKGQVIPIFRCISPKHRRGHHSVEALAKCEDYLAIRQAQAWLATQQSKSGRWICELWEGGHEIYDVGVTSLAIMALQGYGNTLKYGDYQKNILEGIEYLVKIQDEEGLFGRETGQANPFNQALAMIAICEAYLAGDKPGHLREPIRKALGWITRSQNEYSGWGYSSDPNGTSDSVVTSWMCLALFSARACGFSVEKERIQSGKNWFQLMKDFGTGRSGYAFGNGGGPGGLAIRYSKPFDNSAYPRSRAEGITAGGLAIQLLDLPPIGKLGEVSWEEAPFFSELDQQIQLMMKCLPFGEKGMDFHYWLWGSLAIHQLGGDSWARWKTEVRTVLLEKQFQEKVDSKGRDLRGSWDPDTTWGAWGGRIYSTAMATLILETEMRYLPAEKRAFLEFKRLKALRKAPIH